jgi:deoxyribodipyrimidine photo-lyase
VSAPSIIWFRQDLRLRDQAAVAAAAAAGGPVLPVYVLDDAAAGRWAMGGASRWWLHHSLTRLDADLRARGARLILLRGDAVEHLSALAAATGATTIHATPHWEPWARLQEQALAERLTLALHGGTTLLSPFAITSGAGTPFKVFTPFWRALFASLPPALPAPAPERLTLPANAPAGDTLDQWQLLPSRPNWAQRFPELWTPGEAGAAARLSAFAGARARAYGRQRDLPAVDGTSGLSPHLHFGEVSLADVWHAIADAVGAEPAEPYLRQLGWRDFSAGLITHSPDFADVNWKRSFDAFPWRHDPASLRAWQRGETGYPIVDAGMRQLWALGWMHNRVRMITASFLIKHLLIDWRAGEAWFWDTLVDADLGNNAAGWQWVAGSGADASPYFRIFNPITQGEKFDPTGAYIRAWVPELARLPDAHLHAPWTAPPAVLAAAGVRLGATYPHPLVDHAAARARALAAYDTIKAA